jgi:hypothetical protein
MPTKEAKDVHPFLLLAHKRGQRCSQKRPRMPTKEAKDAHKRGPNCLEKKKKKKKKEKRKKEAQDATSFLPLAQSWLSLSFSTHNWLSLFKIGHSCPFFFS